MKERSLYIHSHVFSGSRMSLPDWLMPLILSACLLLLFSSCSSIEPKEARTPAASPDKEFKAELPKKVQEYASPQKIEALNPHEIYQYRIGPGDVIGINVWHRPELTQDNIIVSPDGYIAVPRLGSINVMNRTQIDVQDLITKKLEVLYIKPEVSIKVQEFHNNKAFVLGRVSKPGVVNFPGQGTLLEALALAGGLPDQAKETSLTKCAIIRGNDTVIWVNLQDLLNNGNMALNARILNNDIIYIPEAADELVYVMGEVVTPGAIQLKNGMNVLKAIMLAGGMNKHANPEKVFIIRQQSLKGDVIKIDMKSILEHGDFTQNYALMSNDILYVGPSGMAKFNYALEKFLPSLSVLSLGTSTLETFGIMQELRKKLWGQEGFVNSSGNSGTTTK
ncbi:MAG: sugar transporter [Chlorobiaceae bacterium]|nr:sugar transporter [Chlorobiaceae bacterium]